MYTRSAHSAVYSPLNARARKMWDVKMQVIVKSLPSLFSANLQTHMTRLRVTVDRGHIVVIPLIQKIRPT